MSSFARLLFVSRYILIPFYLLGVMALLRYLISFTNECLHLFFSHEAFDAISVFLVLDGIMVASIMSIIVIGSYVVFVPPTVKMKMPPAFRELNTNLLKKNMAASLAGISSVNIAQEFVGLDAESAVNWDRVWAKVVLHAALLMGLLIFFVIHHFTHHPVEEKEAHHA